MRYHLVLALVLPIFLIGVQNVWAPSNEPTFYGFSHFKNLPVLHPGETKQFEIKIENAHGSTLYGLDPQILIYPRESNPFIDIRTDFVSELKNGQIGTIHVTITADKNLPIKDLQVAVYFTANDEKENVLTGAWSGPVDNTIVVQPPHLLSQKILAPLKQFKSGIAPKDIVCKEGFELVIKSTNGHSACVKPQSAEKLIQRTWAAINKVSELNAPEIYHLMDGEKTFQIQYSLKGAKLAEIVKDDREESIHVILENAKRGELTISIPRDLIDAKLGQTEYDDVFIVLIDGKEHFFAEKAGKSERTLTISFPEGARDIEIIGTNWI
ncbi:MAG TPA: hypothetical protein VNK07_00285 [Candidatus Binatia bacterium]|nr:hypothetical protein [Candidatus Binatia bacterium]